MSHERQSYTEGEHHTVSPHNETDREAAIEAFRTSAFDEQVQSDALNQSFGARSVSPPRSHVTLGTPGRSSLRSDPYARKPLKPQFYYLPNGQEYLKSHMQCDPGHSPTFGNSIPFSLYETTHLVKDVTGRRNERPGSSACIHNSPNIYLSWDSDKSKYCCNSRPDSNQMIMDKCMQNIKSMLSGVAIDRKSIHLLNHAIAKYLKYFKLEHSSFAEDSLVAAEIAKMDRLRRAFETNLEKEPHAKSKREEIRQLSRPEANALWGATYARLTNPSKREPTAEELSAKLAEGGRTRVKRSKRSRSNAKRRTHKRRKLTCK